MKKMIGLVCMNLGFMAHFAMADSGNWSQRQYESLTSNELQLQMSSNNRPIVGMSVEQRNSPEGFCRKYEPVVPNAVSKFACFRLATTGSLAQTTFEAIDENPVNVGFYFQGEKLLGVSWNEKDVVVDGLEQICTANYPITPHPIVTYSCFIQEVPLGGGISIGN